MFHRFATVVFLTGAFAAGVPALAESIDKSFDESFEVTPGARLRLEHGDGDVEIRPWDRDEIAVSVRYRVETTKIGLGRIGDFDVTFDQRGDTVSVQGKEGSSGGVGIFARRHLEYHYRIQAPPWVVLDLEGDDGDVDIEGMTGRLTVHLDDGDLRLSEIDVDEARIRTEDGSVDVDAVRGSFDIESDDGDVEVRDCDCSRLRIDIADGDVEVDGGGGELVVRGDDGSVRVRDRGHGNVDVKTEDGRIVLRLISPGERSVHAESDDGDIEVWLDESIGAAFDIETDDGDVDIEIADASIQRGRHRVHGSFGDGRADLRLTTSDGSVSIGRIH